MPRPMNSPESWRSWRNCRRVNGQRALTNWRGVTSTLTLSQKNFLRCGSVEFKAATLRDHIRIVPSEFRDAMLGGKGRYRSGPPNLRAAGDGNHDGCLLLTFLRRLNGKTAAAPDGSEDDAGGEWGERDQQ